VNPAAVAASAADRERMPERQMNATGASGRTPAAARSSKKPRLTVPSGNDCHSTTTTPRPSGDRSGRPTYDHSALVRTSTRTASGSRSSSAYVSTEVNSPA
jgi:hypothetical protein